MDQAESGPSPGQPGPGQPGPAQPDLSEYVAVNTTTVSAGGSLTIDAYDMNLGNAVSPGSTALSKASKVSLNACRTWASSAAMP